LPRVHRCFTGFARWFAVLPRSRSTIRFARGFWFLLYPPRVVGSCCQLDWFIQFVPLFRVRWTRRLHHTVWVTPTTHGLPDFGRLLPLYTRTTHTHFTTHSGFGSLHCHCSTPRRRRFYPPVPRLTSSLHSLCLLCLPADRTAKEEEGITSFAILCMNYILYAVTKKKHRSTRILHHSCLHLSACLPAASRSLRCRPHYLCLPALFLLWAASAASRLKPAAVMATHWIQPKTNSLRAGVARQHPTLALH